VLVKRGKSALTFGEEKNSVLAEWFSVGSEAEIIRGVAARQMHRQNKIVLRAGESDVIGGNTDAGNRQKRSRSLVNTYWLVARTWT